MASCCTRELRPVDYESFVTKELDQLRGNLLRYHEAQRGALLLPMPDEGVLHIPVETESGTREHEEDETQLTRWVQLTTRLLDESDAAPMVRCYDELRMRQAWSLPLQDLIRRSQPASYQKVFSTELITMKMNEPMKDKGGFCMVLKPNSWQQLLWTTMGALLILWDLITIPLGFFELPEFLRFLTSFARFSFAYWLVDVPLHLVFGTEINGAQEMRPKKLLEIYLRSWFLIDVMIISIDAVIITLEVFQETGDEFSMWRSARFFRALRLLRLLRLLRVTKLQQEVMIIANRLLSTNAFLILKVGSGLFMMLVTNHIIACCWFGIGSFHPGGRSWITEMQLDTSDFSESYAASLHWSLTQFTPATNNINPDNAAERFFALFVVLLAIGIFSSFVASISSSLNTLRSSRVQNSKQYLNLFQFFNERNLSVNLYGKVKEVLRNGNLNARIQEKDVDLILKIPERLKMQLHQEMYLPVLRSVPIWPRQAAQDSDYLYSTICHQAMIEGLAAPGQDVFMPGTDCQYLYIMEEGAMFYLARPEDGAEILERAQLCLACLWTEWNHRGRLSSGQRMCYFVKVESESFGQLVTKFGGSTWRYLQIFGILLVSEIEFMQDACEPVDDINLQEAQLLELAMRAERYADAVAPQAETQRRESSFGRILTRMKSSATG